MNTNDTRKKDELAAAQDIEKTNERTRKHFKQERFTLVSLELTETVGGKNGD